MDLPSSAANFDWGRCIFCQNVTPKNKTTCPADSKRSDVGSGYKTLAEIVSGYREIDSLPKNVPVDHWDEGDGMKALSKLTALVGICHVEKFCMQLH